ncbi:MAG: ATP-binding domain-containing protein, partial [Acidobacteria bacterium]|nr:ATP-binding domain-containing protein [Acidobacteriota bacterium]
AADRGETVAEFLDHAALVADTDDLDEAAQVTLLTAHSAKGLEFSLVILAGMEERLFPHSRSMDTVSGIEEERRLCYVGMTRAQKQLVLTRARYRRRFGGGEMDSSIPSRFLAEAPAELVEDLSPVRERLSEWSEEGVDLYAEQRLVREMARRTTYTGKTYNSVENVAEFFASKGITPKRRTGEEANRRKGQEPGVASSPLRLSASSRPAFRAGVRVHHPKYGTGTVLRREGEGDDAKITVSFPGHGLKKLIEKYATLRQE